MQVGIKQQEMMRELSSSNSVFVRHPQLLKIEQDNSSSPIGSRSFFVLEMNDIKPITFPDFLKKDSRKFLNLPGNDDERFHNRVVHHTVRRWLA